MKQPISVSSPMLNAVAVVPATIALFVLPGGRLSLVDVAALVLFLLASGFGVVELLFNKSYLRSSAGLERFSFAKIDFFRALCKCFGMAGLTGMCFLVYWVLPEYSRNFYGPFFEISKAYGWVFAGLVVLYVFVIDGALSKPEDAYFRFGSCLIRGRLVRAVVDERELVFSWVVKGFFLPLMMVFLISHLSAVADMDFRFSVGTLEHILFGIDVSVATVGYLMTARLFDAHIRSSQPGLLGWIVALACYPPLNTAVLNAWLGYRQYLSAVSWTMSYPAVELVLDVVSLFLVFVYVAATIALGCRFSNLTDRGIVTNGVYSLTKHPAYISKNAYWWLAVFRSLPPDLVLATKAVLTMMGVSLVYWLRAKSEELHLRKSNEYICYEKWLSNKNC